MRVRVRVGVRVTVRVRVRLTLTLTLTLPRSAGLVARCGRLALARLEPMLRLVAPLLFKHAKGPPPPGGGALSRYTVELLLRALLPALPAPVLVDELMAICALPLPDRYARQPATPVTVGSSLQVALLAPLCCALAPLVQEPTPTATPSPSASSARQLGASPLSPTKAAASAAL